MRRSLQRQCRKGEVGQTRRRTLPTEAGSDRIAAPACSDRAAINAGQALSDRRRPKLGQKHRLQSHLRFGRVQFRAPQYPLKGRYGAGQLFRTDIAGAMDQSGRFGVLLWVHGDICTLNLKIEGLCALYVLGHRLRAMLGHRHHMRKCTRHKELQRHKNDDDTTDDSVSFCLHS